MSNNLPDYIWTKGQCYLDAYRYAELLHQNPSGPQATVVHGVILGRSGIRHGHAWVELELDGQRFCRDSDSPLLTDAYREQQRVLDSKPYTFEEARELHRVYNHEGPWAVRLDVRVIKSTPVKVALVACCGDKLGHKAPAQELYRSTLFKKASAYAQALVGKEYWFILSAKHGLVAPEQELEPYDLTLRKMPKAQRQAWGQRVLSQLAALDYPEDTVFIMLAGEDYCAPLGKLNMERPLKGLGIGEQLAFLTPKQ